MILWEQSVLRAGLNVSFCVQTTTIEQTLPRAQRELWTIPCPFKKCFGMTHPKRNTESDVGTFVDELTVLASLSVRKPTPNLVLLGLRKQIDVGFQNALGFGIEPPAKYNRAAVIAWERRQASINRDTGYLPMKMSCRTCRGNGALGSEQCDGVPIYSDATPTSSSEDRTRRRERPILFGTFPSQCKRAFERDIVVCQGKDCSKRLPRPHW